MSDIRSDARNYLKQIEKMDIQIKQKQLQLAELKEFALSYGSFNYDQDKVITSTDNKSMNKVVSYVDIEKDIQKTCQEYAELKNKIINEIHGLKNKTYVEVLHIKYIEYKDTEDIMNEMHYSFDYSKHILGNAITAFAYKYKKEIKKYKNKT